MSQSAPPSPPVAATNPVRARFDRFELDEENARLTCEGKAIALPPTPFAVLCALVRQSGALVTKNGLLDEVWGHRFVTESVLKTVIGKLRMALADDARHPRYIETVARRGYRFIGAASPVARAPRPDGAAPYDAGSLTPESALGRIRELLRHCTGRKPLLLVLDHPQGAEQAGAALLEYIARWSPGSGDAALPAQ